jgi:hypothetical protein
MRWRRGTLLVTTTVMAFALSACGEHNIGSPTNGIVAGTLEAVGGIASGFHPFSEGTVTISAGRVPHYMRVTANGTFRFSVPPGDYRVTGTSPLYGNGSATCGGVTVRVKPNVAVSINVVCQES